jgi:tryptophan 2,3-dioxygenase
MLHSVSATEKLGTGKGAWHYNVITMQTDVVRIDMKKREVEESIHTKLSRDDDYTGYLQLDKLLTAQVPLSDPPHHDEMLFIVQHQVAELWIKLIIHEIGGAIEHLRADDLQQALKKLARVRHVQNQLYSQWKVLDTLTPSEYLEFRHVFGKASGFQSAQYRLLEFTLGNKNPATMAVYEQQPQWHARLILALEAPGLFDEFLRHLARLGMPVPGAVIDRDFSQPRDDNDDVVTVLKTIYENHVEYWDLYETCEALMDIGNNFQFWRFHHMKTVERIIGHKRGSGGSSGVSFLKRALDFEFFPELIRVRTEIE